MDGWQRGHVPGQEAIFRIASSGRLASGRCDRSDVAPQHLRLLRVQSCIDKKVSAPHAHPPACGRGSARRAPRPSVQRRAGRRGWFRRMRMRQGEQRPRGRERPRCAHEAPLARGWRGAPARASAGAAAPVVRSAWRLWSLNKSFGIARAGGLCLAWPRAYGL